MFENVEDNAIAKVVNLLHDHPDIVNAKTLDLDVFQDLRRSIGDDRVFSDLVTIYFNSAEILIESIQVAFVNKDASKFFIAAHSLKSTSASIGAIKLSKICRYFEKIGKTGEITISAEILKLLDDEYREVITPIQTCILAFMPELSQIN
ncbi:MAG: Hpt domain-containing protein [Pseudanabaena sp. CAN_BIN31]|nr:Hpt domain-containing protein [Pseudanabaena sp. CAN_BIN31]